MLYMQAVEFDPRRGHSGVWAVAQLPLGASSQHHCSLWHQLYLPLLPGLCCKAWQSTWTNHQVSHLSRLITVSWSHYDDLQWQCISWWAWSTLTWPASTSWCILPSTAECTDKSPSKSTGIVQLDMFVGTYTCLYSLRYAAKHGIYMNESPSKSLTIASDLSRHCLVDTWWWLCCRGPVSAQGFFLGAAVIGSGGHPIQMWVSYRLWILTRTT